VSDYHQPAIALYFITGSERLLRGLRYWYNMAAELGSQERNVGINVCLLWRTGAHTRKIRN